MLSADLLLRILVRQILIPHIAYIMVACVLLFRQITPKLQVSAKRFPIAQGNSGRDFPCWKRDRTHHTYAGWFFISMVLVGRESETVPRHQMTRDIVWKLHAKPRVGSDEDIEQPDRLRLAEFRPQDRV